MLSEIPDCWKPSLKEIDEKLEQTADLHFIGGFVVAMLYDLERETSDVDFIDVVPQDAGGKLSDLAGQRSLLYKKYKVYLDPVTVATTPESYEDRLTQIFPKEFKHLKLYVLDPYDLALTKLERNGPKDREDILRLAEKVPFDLAVFRERYEKEFKVYVEHKIFHRSTFDFWIEMIEEVRAKNS